MLADEVRWISFHSGYDFGYLLKLLTCTALPATELEFFELLKLYFPNVAIFVLCERVGGGREGQAREGN